MARELLFASHLVKYFGERKILEVPRFVIREGDRIGVVGANGAGKTTLLNLLSGELAPEEGVVRRAVEPVYFRQFRGKDQEAAPKALREMGMESKVGYSGGEKARLGLAAVEEGTLLLFADEPTANLDEEGIELCCHRLEQCAALLLVSHDRNLLDRLCNHIAEVRDGRVTLYPGNYSAYRRQREEKEREDWAAYEQYRKERARLEEAVRCQGEKSRGVKKAPSRMGNSEARLHRRSAGEKAEKLDNAKKALQSRLERLEVREKPRALPQVAMDFSLTHPPVSKTVVSGSRLQVAYGENRLLQNAAFTLPAGSKTALLGPNGAGKTTLMRRIAENGPGIRLAPGARPGFFQQELENLDLEKTVLENAMEDSVQSEGDMRGILARLLFRREDVYKKAGVLSGGERVKLSFARLLGSAANLLLLDEPTNFLDLPSVEALQSLVREYAGTVLFVSHDRAFTEHCATRLLRIENKKLVIFEGTLSQWEESLRHPRETPEDTRRAVLELRITQVIAGLSTAQGEEKEKLEREFQELLRQRKREEP